MDENRWLGFANRIPIDCIFGERKRQRIRVRSELRRLQESWVIFSWFVRLYLYGRFIREGDNHMSERNLHWGSTLEDFLNEEGICDAAKAEAATRVISWQTAEDIRKKSPSQNR
jgi:hypothetical protein